VYVKKLAKKEIGDEQFLMVQLGKVHVIYTITLERDITSYCQRHTSRKLDGP
jgi:hypothetical protein